MSAVAVNRQRRSYQIYDILHTKGQLASSDHHVFLVGVGGTAGDIRAKRGPEEEGEKKKKKKKSAG